MTTAPHRRRRLALAFARLAMHVMPRIGSMWIEAMRQELDHIESDGEALTWAIGCLAVSCRMRLADRWRFGVRLDFRHATAIGAALLLGGIAIEARADGQTVPTFVPTACDLPDVSPEMRPRLQCGTVSVPRTYDNPDLGIFHLAVVVVRSAHQPALPDPVVYISGGPGSPLTIYSDYQGRHPYAPDRDLILVDQRGTGRSEPSLCPDLGVDLLYASVAVASDPTAGTLSRSLDLHLACRDEARARGIDLSDFGTTITVEDFERVRQALGVTRWDVFGESYGTTVAMTLLARHPEAIRSAVLDSLYPPDPYLPLWSKRMADARDAFFTTCAADPACAAAFPDLAGRYADTLKRLTQLPLPVPLPPELNYPDDRVRLTASLFELVVDQMVYYPTYYAGLPRMIAGVNDGDTKAFGASFAALLAGAKTEANGGLNTAVECRDRPHAREPLAAGADPLDALRPPGVCADWSDLGPPPSIPAGTKVPTLVLAGQLDPNYEPDRSHHIADLIGPDARWIEFLLVGHNVRHFSPCAATIVANFIDDPQRMPDASCAGAPASIQYQPR